MRAGPSSSSPAAGLTLPVTERVQADGQWTITLAAATPKTVRDRIGLLDHVVVTGARLTDTALDTTTVLAQARYCGVLRDRPGDEAEQGYRIGGPGLSWWLQTVVTETAVSHTDGTFSTWVGSLLGLVDDRLTEGTVQTVSGTLTHSSHLETVKTALNYVADFFDAAWRVNPDGTVDVGDDLFAAGEAVIVRGTSGREPNVAGLSADRLETGEDLEDYANRVVVVADEGETVAADETPSGEITFQTLLGNTARITRLVAAPNTDTDNVSTVAARELSNRNQTRRALTLSSDVYDIGRDVKAGDTVEVYDPDVGLVDTGRQLLYRGRTINPVALETYAVTWPVQDGMGVYLLTADGVVDLSEWVVWEDSSARVEVGAQARRLTQAGRDAASEDVARWDKFDTHMRDYVDRGGEPVDTAEVVSGTAASLTLTVPTGWTGPLAVIGTMRSDHADTSVGMRFKVNAVNSTNAYRAVRKRWSGSSTPTVTFATGDDSMGMDIVVPAANATSAEFGSVELMFPNPNRSGQRLRFRWLAEMIDATSAASSVVTQGTGRIIGAEPLTSITFEPGSGAFVAGTRFELRPA